MRLFSFFGISRIESFWGCCMMYVTGFFCLILSLISSLGFSLELGVDRLFQPEYIHLVKDKRVALATNHTGITSTFQKTEQIFVSESRKGTFDLICFFCPEHGFRGVEWACTAVANETHECGVPIYSLHGKTRKPTPDMLQGVDVIVFDMQDLGCRSYTYASTLFSIMEEAAKKHIEVVVLDRPNPLGGEYVDGPMLESRLKSFVGYLNVPYCHGMTIGELAIFFQKQSSIPCTLHVVPMNGWKRSMRFTNTGLCWIPPSPHIPSAHTALLYPATGILGTLSFVNIGIGYTLPFELVVAPWLEAKRLAAHLNKAKLAGVHFQEIWIKPFWGPWKDKVCQGVQVLITDQATFNPVRTFFLLISTLRDIYPSKTLAALKTLPPDSLFAKVCGSGKVLEILKQEHPYQALVDLHKDERQEFMKLRKPCLLKEYDS